MVRDVVGVVGTVAGVIEGEIGVDRIYLSSIVMVAKLLELVI